MKTKKSWRGWGGYPCRAGYTLMGLGTPVARRNVPACLNKFRLALCSCFVSGCCDLVCDKSKFELNKA